MLVLDRKPYLSVCCECPRYEDHHPDHVHMPRVPASLSFTLVAMPYSMGEIERRCNIGAT